MIGPSEISDESFELIKGTRSRLCEHAHANCFFKFSVSESNKIAMLLATWLEVPTTQKY